MTTDLERALRARGAVLEAFHGVTLPAHFGDVGREWRAAREGGAVFAAGLRALIAATGEDRVAFLQGMLSNDVKALAAGQGTLRRVPHAAGKGRLRPARLRGGRSPPARRRRLAARGAAGSARTLHRRRRRGAGSAADEQPLLGLEGPLARAIAGEALGVARPAADAVRRTPALTFEGAPVLVVAASEVDRDGILLCGAAALRAGAVRRLRGGRRAAARHAGAGRAARRGRRAMGRASTWTTRP